jgi:hypothetical protein
MTKKPIELTPEEIKVQQLQKQFASIRKMNTTHLNKALSINPSVLSKFNSKQVADFLQNPVQYEKQLRQLSNYLYNVSSQYRQVIKHMATMATYDYTLNITEMPVKINADKITKAYTKSAQYVDKLNLKHEMSKALKTSFKEDFFYGYEHESKDSYFIQKLDADYCRICSIEDGVFNYAFDFSYFDKFKDSLELFPDEFRVKYQIYELNKQTNRWLEMDSNKTICIKIMEDIKFGIPPYNTVFESIFDLDEYKKIKKAKAKMDNFLLIVQNIPMVDGNDADVFKISLPKASEFHHMLSDNLPDGVAAVTSPMTLETIKMEKTKGDADTIAQAQREVYTDSGISQYLFNSDKNTSAGIGKSIISDENFLFDTLNQIERWVNRKLKRQSGTITFYIKFLQVTNFSREEVFNRYLKAAQFGSPVKMEIGASLGLTPLEVLNKITLENEVFKLHEKFIPLASSHTQAGDDEGGRPSVKETDRSDSTQTNIDNSDE